MREFVDVPQVFDGEKPVFILGGGASMDGFDWSSLPPEQCIALNKAHRFCKTAAIFFFGDHKYYEREKAPHGGQDFWQFEGEHLLTTADVDVHEKSRLRHIATKKSKFSTDAAYIAQPGKQPLNTGWQAVNLAYLAGARKIILLGYDCVPGQYGHGFSWAHPSTPGDAVYERYIKEFDDLAKSIKSKKIKLEIVNANPDSALECWPKCTLEEALA